MYCNEKTPSETSTLLRAWLESENQNAKNANKRHNGMDFFPFPCYGTPCKASAAELHGRKSTLSLIAWEQALSKKLDITYAHAVNSGAAADLLALSALTSPALGERSLRPGDEVITVALNAAPLIAPILQLGAVPVAADVSSARYNIDTALLEQALSPATRAVMLTHTAGYPFNLKTVRNFCNDYELWLIEDCREAFGATYDFDGTRYAVGTVGDIGCGALPPASPHDDSIGFVCTRDDTLTLILQGLRDGIFADDSLRPSLALDLDFRCGEAQASAAEKALDALDAQLEMRKKSANGVKNALSHLCKFPVALPNAVPTPSALPLLLENAEDCTKLAAALAAASIPYQRFQNAFSAPVLAHFSHRIPQPLAETDQLSACALALPLPRNEAALALLVSTVREALV